MFNLNDEQILELILSYINEDDSRFEGFAGEALVGYVLNKNPNIQSDDEIQKKCCQLITDHVINKLYAKNIIDIEVDDNNEEIITLTERWKNIL